MPSVKDQFKSSYGAFTARERELERSRARRDARDAVQELEPATDRPTSTAERPSP